VDRGASAVPEPFFRGVFCLFAARHRCHLRSLAPAVCQSEGDRSSLASPLCGPGVSDEPPASPVGGAIRAWRCTRAGARECAWERRAVGGVAARRCAQGRRPGRHDMAGAAASIRGPQIRNRAQRRAPDGTRALPVVFRDPAAGGDPENCADRRCDHEGTDAARRSGADASAVSPHRHSRLCARPDVGVPAADRTPDRALSGGHSLGGGRCAP
jgi:hypothetical protein